MKKFILIILLFTPFFICALEFPKVNSKMVEIYDLKDKNIIYEIKSNNKASIASLTKIATTITAIENISNLDEQVTITSKILNTVRWDASRAGLKVGDKVTYRDLLYASIIPSGADATNSIAILSSGSIENFVKKMNDLIKKIGLKNTHFSNVTGLDDKDHYSTADDVRKLLEYSLKNQTFREIFTTKKYQLSNGLNVRSTFYSYSKDNEFINTQIIGAKTGFTLDAGYCLASLSNINGHEMIVIVLKADLINYDYYNALDTISLISFLKDNYKDQLLLEKNSIIKDIPVVLSKIESYKIHTGKDIKKFLPSDFNKNDLKIEYNGLDELNYRNHKGDKIGTVSYYYKENLITTEDIFLNQKIKMSFSKVLKKNLPLIIVLSILFILFIILKRKIRRLKRLKKRMILKNKRKQFG